MKRIGTIIVASVGLAMLCGAQTDCDAHKAGHDVGREARNVGTYVEQHKDQWAGQARQAAGEVVNYVERNRPDWEAQGRQMIRYGRQLWNDHKGEVKEAARQAARDAGSFIKGMRDELRRR